MLNRSPGASPPQARALSLAFHLSNIQAIPTLFAKHPDFGCRSLLLQAAAMLHFWNRRSFVPPLSCPYYRDIDLVGKRCPALLYCQCTGFIAAYPKITKLLVARNAIKLKYKVRFKGLANAHRGQNPSICGSTASGTS